MKHHEASDRPTLSQWRSDGSFFDHNGTAIFYRKSRKADESILCIHGFPTSSYDFHKIWGRLTERFPVVAFDLIGYGSSAKPQTLDYTTFLQTDVLQGLIEHLGLRRIHILSHDYGNTITLELFARIAEGRSDIDIGSVCMLNGALFPETHRPILAQKLLLSSVGAAFGRLIPDIAFKTSLSKVFGETTKPSPDELDDFVNAFKLNGGKKIAHKLIRYMTERTTHRERWLEALRNISAPYRFINGLADPVSGAHLVKRFRELVPEKRDIIELEKIGHFPHFEAPEILTDFVVAFFSGSFSRHSGLEDACEAESGYE